MMKLGMINNDEMRSIIFPVAFTQNYLSLQERNAGFPC